MRELRRDASLTFYFTSIAAHERSAPARAPALPDPFFAARKAQTGLTLIEVMIVAVIVAILALIAYPSYEEQLRKGRRAAAQELMVEIAARQQQYLLDARAYAVGAGALAALNLTVPGEVSKFYTVSIDPAAPTLPPSFTVTATPVLGSRQAPDGVLTLDHQGAKTRNGRPGW